MSSSKFANTQAILLLTAPLIVGKGKRQGADRPLPPTEYNKVARCLKEQGLEPADLLRAGGVDALRQGLSLIELDHIKRLLERGFLLSQATGHWQSRAIWVVSRADDEYPKLVRKWLRDTAPPVLYGCGNQKLLENGGLAVIGSRNTSKELIEYAKAIGCLAARTKCAIISGGARGVDQAAMHGALIAGGTATGILTGDLEREALNREHREMLMEDQLVLISPYDPNARFSVGNAMQRNKLIYALADAGLVIESDYNKGGTWNGAVEQLDKLRFVPVYTRSEGEISAGLQGLLQKGAKPWPNPETPGEFRAVLTGEQLPSKTKVPKQETLLPNGLATTKLNRGDTAAQVSLSSPPIESLDTPDISPANTLFAMVERLLEAIDAPVKEEDVAIYLQVEKSQAKAWLKRLVEEGKYQRKTKPVRYVRSPYVGKLVAVSENP